MTVPVQARAALPSSEEVRRVEGALGVTFDAAFVAFVRQYNGGKPAPNRFRVDDRIDAGVNSFIPLADIPYQRQFISEQVGLAIVPIAHAEGGNFVCLSTIMGEEGAIYFFDHEVPGRAALILISASIDELINILQPCDSDEVVLRPGQVKRAWINPNLLKK